GHSRGGALASLFADCLAMRGLRVSGIVVFGIPAYSDEEFNCRMKGQPYTPPPPPPRWSRAVAKRWLMTSRPIFFVVGLWAIFWQFWRHIRDLIEWRVRRRLRPAQRGLRSLARTIQRRVRP